MAEEGTTIATDDPLPREARRALELGQALGHLGNALALTPPGEARNLLRCSRNALRNAIKALDIL